MKFDCNLYQIYSPLVVKQNTSNITFQFYVNIASNSTSVSEHLRPLDKKIQQQKHK